MSPPVYQKWPSEFEYQTLNSGIDDQTVNNQISPPVYQKWPPALECQTLNPGIDDQTVKNPISTLYTRYGTQHLNARLNQGIDDQYVKQAQLSLRLAQKMLLFNQWID